MNTWHRGIPMALPDRVLVDTSAFYALRSATDRYHRRANGAYERLIDREQELWTTSYTLVETVALLHRRLGFEVVREFSEWRRQANLQVLWIDRRMHDEAWDRFMAEKGRGLSFVDWTTAVASREMEDAPVFTFDAGFGNVGRPVVPR